MARSEDSTSLRETRAILIAKAENKALNEKHYTALMEACGGEMPASIGFSVFSQKCFNARNGSQPSNRYPGEVNYAVLLAEEGMLE